MRRVPRYRATFNGDGTAHVVLGSGVYSVDTDRPPVDFFLHYVSQLIPDGWLDAIHGGVSHPLTVWMGALAADLRDLPDTDDIKVLRRHLRPESGAMMLLANDIYTLDVSRRLQRVLVERLARTKDFQGVAHEIAVAATMIRAGFDIAFEDESDSSRKHPEFIATHRKSGVQVAVEAKSLHRHGVLGFLNGNPPPQPRSRSAHKIAAQVCGQVERALPKARKMPFVVFVDLNLPPGVLEHWGVELHFQFEEILPRVDSTYSHHGVRTGRTLSLLVATNRPMHLGLRAEGYDVQNLFITPSQRECRFPLEPRLIIEIKDAVKCYGTVEAIHGRSTRLSPKAEAGLRDHGLSTSVTRPKGSRTRTYGPVAGARLGEAEGARKNG